MSSRQPFFHIFLFVSHTAPQFDMQKQLQSSPLQLCTNHVENIWRKMSSIWHYLELNDVNNSSVQNKTALAFCFYGVSMAMRIYPDVIYRWFCKQNDIINDMKMTVSPVSHSIWTACLITCWSFPCHQDSCDLSRHRNPVKRHCGTSQSDAGCGFLEDNGVWCLVDHGHGK